MIKLQKRLEIDVYIPSIDFETLKTLFDKINYFSGEKNVTI